MKYVLSLVCFLATVLAQGSVEVTLTTKAAQSVHVEVRADPAQAGGGEMRFILYRDDDDSRNFELRVAPPVEPGVYRLEYPFTEGRWGIQLRFGTGVDLHEAWVNTYIEPTKDMTQNLRGQVYSSLPPSTPDYVQPLGFAVFGVIFAIALTLITVILRWLKRQQVSGVRN